MCTHAHTHNTVHHNIILSSCCQLQLPLLHVHVHTRFSCMEHDLTQYTYCIVKHAPQEGVTSNIAPYICQHLTLENPFKRTLHSLTHSHPPSNHHTAIITTENTLCGLLLNASQLQVFAGPRLAQAQGPNPQATVYSNRKTSTTFHGQLNRMLFTEVQGYLHVCNKHL